MKLERGIHLAYCTNVHRGESWPDTFRSLQQHTLPVRDRVGAGEPYAIGLRLGAQAASELTRPETLSDFRRWLERENCYIFTINGFPYGNFHGARVKERVYAPDWSTAERLEYTKRLIDLIAILVPSGVAGSVSTVPGSFKAFIEREPERRERIFAQLTECARHLEAVSEKSGRDLHLGLEPEPLCLIETSQETVEFFQRWQESDPAVAGLRHRVGMNYDCCHLAVEFESAREALDRLTGAGIRLSKLHLSSALCVRPDATGRAALSAYNEPTYLHQVVAARAGRVRRRFIDLPDALNESPLPSPPDDEWRVHFHIPLYAEPGAPFRDTRAHLLEALDWIADHPGSCEHFEMETYTWEVLPEALRTGIEDQLVAEYAWVLDACRKRGLAKAPVRG